MELIANVSKKEYEQFVLSHPTKSHFLESHLWGELKGNYVCIALKEDDKIKAATLLLKKKLFLNYSYFYSPRGYVVDFNRESLIEEFTTKLKDYVKKEKGIFFRIDPDLILNIRDDKGNVLKEKEETKNTLEFLKKIGFKHNGFNQLFEGSQPRFTFRIDLNNPIEVIEDKYSTTTKQRIKKASDLGIMVEHDNPDSVLIFTNLMKETEDRKNFYQHEDSYYQRLYDLFKEGHIKIFLGKANLSEIMNNLTIKKERLILEIDNLKIKEQSHKIEKEINHLEEQLLKLDSDIAKYQALFPNYKETLYLSAHVIIYYGDKAWVLYAGNSNLFPEFYTNYLVYREHIRYAKEQGIKIYDQFGTIGKLDPNHHLYGLHEFKRKFGGDYIEFIGEFDYIINKPLYFIYNKLIPTYRKIIRYIRKKSR